MPSLAEINRQPVPKLGTFTVGNICIHYRRDSEGDCEPTGATIDPFDGTDDYKENDPEKVILIAVSAMLKSDGVSWKHFIEDHANPRLELPEGLESRAA